MPSTMGPLVELPENHIHLWTGRPPSDPEWFRAVNPESVLSDPEQQRWKRLLRADDRNLFVWSHIVLRQVLSRYHPVYPDAWAYHVGEHGRPEISAPDAVDGLRFNLSHTSGLIAIAVNRWFDVGVDVEKIGRVGDIPSVARTTCSPAEQSLLASLDSTGRAEMFARIWTLKESFVKATGQGGYVSIANYSFEPLPSGDIAFTTTDVGVETAEWKFDSSSEPDNHQLTIACRPPQPTTPPELTRFELPTKYVS